MTSTTIVVNSRKYDRSIRRSWSCELISCEDQVMVLRGVFAEDVEHPDLGLISRGTVSIEYFWFERWFNIFRFIEPHGPLRNFYCNIAMPPTFDGSVLDYIDLDIDIVVWPDMSFRVLDEAEFEANSDLFNYSGRVREEANKSLTFLLAKIDAGEFPLLEMAG